jgi:hypothetical protein
MIDEHFCWRAVRIGFAVSGQSLIQPCDRLHKVYTIRLHALIGDRCRKCLSPKPPRLMLCAQPSMITWDLAAVIIARHASVRGEA